MHGVNKKIKKKQRHARRERRHEQKKKKRKLRREQKNSSKQHATQQLNPKPWEYTPTVLATPVEKEHCFEETTSCIY